MKKFLKTLAAITLSTAVIFSVGCKPEEDPINGGGDNGDNGSGLDSHVYVDLGLPSGTLWATCNVGANAPEECGYYFAWGETEFKDSYSWSNYKYCYQIGEALTKYCFDSHVGLNLFTDNLTTLKPEDDAATTNWGNGWRTPTKEEFEELLQNTTKTWTLRNGMVGYLLTANNGNTLFFPAAGRMMEDRLLEHAAFGHYWTKTLSEYNPRKAMRFVGSTTYFSDYEIERYHGLSVRPVRADNEMENDSVLSYPIVTTGDIIEIGRISAKCGFTVVTNEDIDVITTGVYCGTTENPTSDAPIHTITNMSGVYDNLHPVWDGIWMSGLTPNTTYYVRAYAKTSDNNIYYGEQKSFTTLQDYPCYGPFSISEELQVYFSQGNLQYQASTFTWRFAENQWDYVGTEIPDLNGDFGGTVPGSSNHLISNDYDGWIDLFAWGSANSPTLVAFMNITDFVDWGTKPISNAGGHAYPWRTLTKEEWDYLLYGRQTPSGVRFVLGMVNNIKGLILLPDDWNASIYQLSNVNDGPNPNYQDNRISEETWKDILETHGAVFLPWAGYRVNYNVSAVRRRGYYWLAERDWYLDFFESYGLNFPFSYQNNSIAGYSVRLVWCKQYEF